MPHQLLSDDPDLRSSEREIVDLQQGDYEEMDQLAIAKPLCKRRSGCCTRPTSALGSRAPSAPRCLDVRGGVYLDLPAKLFGQVMDAEAGQKSLVKSDRRGATRRFPPPDAVKRALDVLKSAKRPLIILGRARPTRRLMMTFVPWFEKSGIPFLPMSMAKGLLPDTHPQCAGACALDRSERLRCRDADRRAAELAALARQGQDLG